MYTQCPDCGTVFRLTADALRAAQGSVRCGICSSRFNALEFLSEEPLLHPREEPAPDDTITVEELPGTEFIELSTPQEAAFGPAPADDADAVPAESAGAEQRDQEPEPDADVAAPPAGAAEPGEDEEIPEAALEFRGSAEDLERLFVEPASRESVPGAGGIAALEQSMAHVAAADLSGIEVIEESLPGSATEGAGADPGRIAAVLAFRRPAAGTRSTESPAEERPGGTTAGPDEEDFDDPLSRTDEYPVLTIGDDGSAVEEAEALQILIPEELRHPAAPASPEEALADAAGGETGARRWPLAAGLAVLLLALASQAVHFWRDDLVRHPLAGPWLMRAYGLAGLELAPPVDLAAFELRQFGAASDPSRASRLKVRASIVNRAPFAQPYPLLRLSLQDRFGTTIGVRDLEPSEYLPGGGGEGLLAPERRADAEIVFVDPGLDAVGFELDVCLRNAAGVRCAADRVGSGS